MIANLLKKAKAKVDKAIAENPDFETLTIPIGHYLDSIFENLDPRFIKNDKRYRDLGIEPELVEYDPNMSHYYLPLDAPSSMRERWNGLEQEAEKAIVDFREEVEKYIFNKYDVSYAGFHDTRPSREGFNMSLIIQRKKRMKEKYTRLFEMERPTPRASEKEKKTPKSIELPPQVERNLQKFLRMIDEVIKQNRDVDVLKIPVGRLFELADKVYRVSDMKREDLIKAGIPDKYLNKDNSLKERVPLEIFEHWKDLRDLAGKYESEIKRRLKKEATDAGWIASVSQIEDHSRLAGIEHLRIRDSYYSVTHLILKKP